MGSTETAAFVMAIIGTLAGVTAAVGFLQASILGQAPVIIAAVVWVPRWVLALPIVCILITIRLYSPRRTVRLCREEDVPS